MATVGCDLNPQPALPGTGASSPGGNNVGGAPGAGGSAPIVNVGGNQASGGNLSSAGSGGVDLPGDDLGGAAGETNTGDGGDGGDKDQGGAGAGGDALSPGGRP